MPGRAGSGSGRTGGGHSMSGGRNGGPSGGGRAMGGSARGAGRQMTPGGSRQMAGGAGRTPAGGAGNHHGMTGGVGRGPAGGPGHGAMGQPGGAPRPAGMRRRPPHPPVLPFGMRQVPGMSMMGYDESYRVLMALEALMGGRFDPAHIRLVERFFGRQFAPHEYADLYYWMRDYMGMW